MQVFSQILGYVIVVPSGLEMEDGLNNWKNGYRSNFVQFYGIIVVTQSMVLAGRIDWVGNWSDSSIILAAILDNFGVLLQDWMFYQPFSH